MKIIECVVELADLIRKFKVLSVWMWQDFGLGAGVSWLTIYSRNCDVKFWVSPCIQGVITEDEAGIYPKDLGSEPGRRQLLWGCGCQSRYLRKKPLWFGQSGVGRSNLFLSVPLVAGMEEGVPKGWEQKIRMWNSNPNLPGERGTALRCGEWEETVEGN